MSEKIKNITHDYFKKDEFNTAVKKGSLFQIDYYYNFEDRQDIEVISGKVTIVKGELNKETPFNKEFNHVVFRADEADKNGNIVIAVTDHHRADINPTNFYKIHVV